MAAQHRPDADDFDPYLQREEESDESHDENQGTRYTPSPVSSWHLSAGPRDSQGPYQTVSTAGEGQDGTTTPTAQNIKIEPQVHTSSLQPSETPSKFTDKPPHAGGWWIEIISAIFSVLCIIAMVIVLIEFDGKQLSNWVWVISPNAVISVLSTASKATMILPVAECISQLKWIYLNRHGQTSRLEHLQVYDNASRGPLGSLKFFFEARGVSWAISVASYLGCIITIATLAVDPFTQQILLYSDGVQVALGSRSSVPHAQIFDNGDMGMTGAGSYINSARDSNVTAAAVSGLFGLSSTPPFTCPGSNCTFPDFETLGIHPDVCTDVTAQTIKDCDNNCSTRVTSPLTNCTYTTPSGLDLYAYSSFGAHAGFTYTTINTTAFAGRTTSSIMIMGVITFDDAAQLAGTSPACDTSWQDTLAVYECSLDFCAVSYENYSYVDGSLQEGQKRYSRLNKTVMDSEMLVYETLDESFPGNQTYSVNVHDQEAIMQSLLTFFATQYESESVTDVFTSALYNSGNVSQSMRSMAEAMSYQLMQGPNTTMAYGNVTETQTYIHVQWPWLSLTFVLVVFSGGLLLATILITNKAHQLAWKSSLAPLLFADSLLSPVGDGLGRSWTTEHRARRVETIMSGLQKKWH